MTTIHLTDAQRDTFAACGLIVIDGVWRTRHICCGRDDGTFFRATYEEADALRNSYIDAEGHVRSCIVERVAPEGWRIPTEPCDTCGGKGKLGKYPIFNGPGDLIDCPDCVRGLPVVTLTATCPRCNGHSAHEMGNLCRACEHGVITLGRFIVRELVRVKSEKKNLDLHSGQFIARPEPVA